VIGEGRNVVGDGARHQPLRLITRRRVNRWVFLAAVALAVWLTASLAVAYRLTRRSRPVFAEPVPAVAWGQLESHRLPTRDGQTIGAWYSPSKSDAPSVLLLHGNGGSRRQCLHIAEMLAGEGCAVLLISLRAHGDSTGEFNDIGYSARHDVVTAVEFLERRRPGKPVLVHGTSLGAAAATFACGELARRVHGYVLECPYRDLKTAVRNRTREYLPPLLDWFAYEGLLAVAPLVLPDLERISPVDAVAKIPEGVPVLVLAGGQDRKALPEEARAIFDRVRSHARLSIFDSAGHLRLHATDPERYRKEVLGLVREVWKRTGAPGRTSERLSSRHPRR
jgi:alpha-beta hydrolase superfamily lysophospholipase